MTDEDEVERRARLIAEAHAVEIAKQQALEDRRISRLDEIENAIENLLNEIYDKASERTAYSFAVTDDSVICFTGTEEDYVEHALFKADVSSSSEDIESDDWSLSLRCAAAYSSDPEVGFEGDETWADYEGAVEYGVEAVLDGLAVLTARGERIADADAIMEPRSSAFVEPSEPEPVSQQVDPRPMVASPPAKPKPAFGPAIVVLIVAALLVWAFARFSH